MTDLLDLMRERLEDARSKLAARQQAFQTANAELQAANAEFGVWNNAVALETKAREKRAAEAQSAQISMNLPELAPTASVTSASCNDDLTPSPDHVIPAPNKTEKVREILRAHGGGIFPSDLWVEVKDSVSSRAYLYSILKRLRDKDEVSIRRGKYLLRSKTVEVENTEKGVVVQ